MADLLSGHHFPYTGGHHISYRDELSSLIMPISLPQMLIAVTVCHPAAFGPYAVTRGLALENLSLAYFSTRFS